MKKCVEIKQSAVHVLQCSIGHSKYIDIIFASWIINYVEQQFSICLTFSRTPCVLK